MKVKDMTETFRCGTYHQILRGGERECACVCVEKGILRGAEERKRECVHMR